MVLRDQIHLVRTDVVVPAAQAVSAGAWSANRGMSDIAAATDPVRQRKWTSHPATSRTTLLARVERRSPVAATCTATIRDRRPSARRGAREAGGAGRVAEPGEPAPTTTGRAR